MDLSKLSDKDLLALKSGGVSAVSDEGLKALYATAPKAAASEAPKEASWGDVGISAVKNLPQSTWNIVKGLANAAAHPIDTVGNVVSLAGGAVQNVLPGSFTNPEGNYGKSLDKMMGGSKKVIEEKAKQDSEEARGKAKAVGNYLSDRYGSVNGLKNALANDPAGVLADASTILTGGGSLAAKIPALSKVGQAAGVLGRSIEPLTIASKSVAPVGQAVGKAAANFVGGVGTRTGGESLAAAAKAGMKGGQTAKEFTQNLRGEVPVTDLLNDAKTALDNMRANKAAEYRSGMANVSKDNTILDFGPVDDAMTEIRNIGSFKGKTINRSTADVQDKITSVMNEWKAADPATYHTVEGFDALKRTIGDIRDSTEIGTPSRAAADKAYNAVKQEIVKQAPEYAKIMSDYENASGVIKEIEKTLLAGNKATADTSLRKLLSSVKSKDMGNKQNLLNTLESSGNGNLLSNLYAQTLSNWTPGGLGSHMATGLGAAGVATQNPLLAPIVAMHSPRAMGETALAAGRVAGGVNKAANVVNMLAERLGVNPSVVANYLYQTDLKSNLENK